MWFRWIVGFYKVWLELFGGLTFSGFGWAFWIGYFVVIWGVIFWFLIGG